MITIIMQEKPAQSFLLLKPNKLISPGDTVVFQHDIFSEKVPIVSEQTVIIDHVITGGRAEGRTKGLYEDWQIISWKETKKSFWDIFKHIRLLKND